MFLDAAPARVPFVGQLAAYGEATALITPDGSLTYAELADRVSAAAEQLGTTRRLVLQPMRTDVDAIVGYLGALAGGHPVLLTEDRPDLIESLTERYDPDVVGHARPDLYAERREGTAHELHPDLALLLSTSGSTGSPRLVRLGADGLQANAEAIATYLHIRADDVAVTTLPLHYCYGLSVLHSHLATGAALCLTELSVVDACFWDLVREHRVTSMAGVPHTFDLLDRVGFAEMEVPSLRYLTSAGGRLAPEWVRAYAELGQRKGFDLFVMYGQTEATARMAWLPPDLAVTRPGAIGLPIPGGSLRLSDEQADGVGELVYSGENVMLGYADSTTDLALGRTVEELHTGDLARVDDAGLFEIVGRASRFAKLFGLRLDLDRIEQQLSTPERPVLVTADDARLVVGVVGLDTPSRVLRSARDERVSKGVPHEGYSTSEATGHSAAEVAGLTGLPTSAITVLDLDELPLTSSGKPDRRALLERSPTPSPERPTTVAGLYATLLGRPEVAADDTFVDLGGDSLSYVEASVRLEELLGHLPARWHLRTVGELEAARKDDGRRRTRTVETTVVLRALAILAIVGSHASVVTLTGGAHVLLALAGFNVGRFQVSDAPRSTRVRALLRAARRVAAPSALWIGAVTVATGAYAWYNPLLLNAVLGSEHWSEPTWWYWFIEALVVLVLLSAVLLAVPAIDRLERRWPFWLPLALAGVGLLFRFELLELRGGDVIHRAEYVLWLFALGWAAARASHAWQRTLLSGIVLAATPGFVDANERAAVIMLGVLVLIWVPHLRLPTPAARACALLAGASLTIYLTHWQIHPPVEQVSPLLALAASIVGGVGIWLLARRIRAASRLVRWVVG